MRNPISIPVIRQALKWHGLTPITIRRIDQLKRPDGSIVTSYRCIFTGFNMSEFIGTRRRKNTVSLSVIANRVQGCFCRDIFVFEVGEDDETGEISVMIDTTFKKRDE